jgi:hypothetical protein
MPTLMDEILGEYRGASLQDRLAAAVRNRRQSLINQPTGFEGEQGRALEREILRSDPRRLSSFAPAPQMDQFRESPLAVTEQAQYDPILGTVQSASGAPIARFSPPMREEDVMAQRGAEPNIYQRAARGITQLVSPSPVRAPAAPTYPTESFFPPAQAQSPFQSIVSAVTGGPATPTPSATQAAQATRPQAPVIPATMFGRGDYNDVFNVPYTPAVGGNYNDVFNVPYTPPAAPRQRPLPEVLASRDERTVAPRREPGFFERIFGGTQFQSNNMPVTMPLPMLGAVTPEYINWGDPNRAADFFAADRALMQQNPAMFGLLGGTNG